MKINVEIKSLRLEFHKRKQEIQKHESQVVEINNEERIPKTRVVEITKKKANQQRRRRHINTETTNLDQSKTMNPRLCSLNFHGRASLALPPTIIATIDSGSNSSSSLSTKTKTIFVICGFVPKVGVVFAMGSCLWVCS